MRRGRLGLLALVALALACGGRAGDPRAVVEQYFRCLGRDPIRTLPLLAPSFHEEHALHVVTTAEARRNLAGAALPERVPEDADTTLALDRLELGWLGVQMRTELRDLAARLVVTPIDAGVHGDEATVDVRIQGPEGPPFAQRFTLAREAPGAAWRITGVAQRDLVPANLTAAFVAFPNERLRARLQRALLRPRRGGIAPRR